MEEQVQGEIFNANYSDRSGRNESMSKVDGRSSALDLSAPTFKAFHLERMILITFDPLRLVSLFQRSLCQCHRSMSLSSLIGKTMEIYIYIYTHIVIHIDIPTDRSPVYLSFRTTLIFWYDVTIVFAPFIFCGFGMEVSSNTGFAPFIPPRQW